MLVLLYGAVFFARTAGSLFRVSFFFDGAEKSLVSGDERTAAAWYGALLVGGVLFALASLRAPSETLRALAFACIVLAGTADHLEPKERRDGRWFMLLVSQALRIGGMSALLIGYYVAGLAVFVVGVAAFHWLEARAERKFEI
jgi:hypothetical protein